MDDLTSLFNRDISQNQYELNDMLNSENTSVQSGMNIYDINNNDMQIIIERSEDEDSNVDS